MLFYSQAWHLVLHNKPLLKEKFEAWVHGAAIPAVYQRYKQFGSQAIKDDYDKKEFAKLSEQERELLEDVWEIYGQYDADYLELLNHSEEPWQQARAGLNAFDASNTIISEEKMKEYYEKKTQRSARKSDKKSLNIDGT